MDFSVIMNTEIEIETTEETVVEIDTSEDICEYSRIAVITDKLDTVIENKKHVEHKIL